MTAANANSDPGLDYGEVFTRRWVVEHILDLVEYKPGNDLGALRLVEPSCGTGAFLGPVIDRLILSCQRHSRDLATLDEAIRAFDLLDASAERARKSAAQQLVTAGLDPTSAERIAQTWIATGDFLLQEDEPESADLVVGNPPYIRLESVPRATMVDYRRICASMRGRADIYVGFIERGLSLLRHGGALAFICADRWMHNQYGADLREIITERACVDAIISMHEVDAFEDRVSAYPAIILLRNDQQKSVAVVNAESSFGPEHATEVTSWIQSGETFGPGSSAYEATRVPGWFSGRGLWPSGPPERLAMISDLERRFPPIEDSATGTRVGIGIATGCDDVFITDDSNLVEDDRLLPLLRSSDISSGTVDWNGSYLVNPWDETGLVDLARFPLLQRYFEQHEDRLRRRFVAKARPKQWYKTIDRVHSQLIGRPKLVLPDMKSRAHPVLDDGAHYPHHNLYFVASDRWNPEVLGGLLLSDVANLFVGSYCVKMRGGTFRFQAQYLRCIRVPAIEAISASDARRLAVAFHDRDVEAATGVALSLYGISEIPSAVRAL